MNYTKSTPGKRSGLFSAAGACILCLALTAAFCYLMVGPFQPDTALAVAEDSSSAVSLDNLDSAIGQKPVHAISLEQRLEHLEKTWEKIWQSTKRADSRSYENKMMSRELIRYVKIMVVVLVLIAVGFPLTVWLMSRRRILGLSELSSEVAATLVVVEERQAKLANVLKDIQNEIDYLHTMSVPDLKNLIQQAENYLKQNEKDLERTGSPKAPHA